VSKYNAVAQVGKFEFSGFVAWLAWLGLHLIYLVGFKTKSHAIVVGRDVPEP